MVASRQTTKELIIFIVIIIINFIFRLKHALPRASRNCFAHLHPPDLSWLLSDNQKCTDLLTWFHTRFIFLILKYVFQTYAINHTWWNKIKFNLCFTSNSVHCLSCRVCLDACGSTLNPKRLAIEECPVGDRGCSFITKNQSNTNFFFFWLNYLSSNYVSFFFLLDGTLTLIGGGCTEYIRNSCVTLDFEVICVHSCKGDLCNENIDFRDTKLTNGSK